jgi:hypothetical protein
MPIGEGSYATTTIGVLFPGLTGGGTAAGWAVDLNAPSSLMCSAWGVSRVLDALEWARDNIFVPAGSTRYIDPAKVMVTGTSRGGKQALVVGAFAESQSGTKIAVSFPNASGCLGTSIERFLSPVLNSKMDYYFNLNSLDGPAPVGVTMVAYKDPMVQGTDYDVKYTLGKDAKGTGLDQGFQTQHHAWTDSGGYWPSYRNKQFVPMRTDLNIDKEGGKGYLGTIPYDQHFVMSLVAPRGLLVTCGILDYWNNPESNFMGFLAVREVYKFLDAERAFGLRFFNVAHSGNSLKQAEVVQFANAYFAGVDPDTLKDPAVFGTKSKYRQLDMFPLDDPRSFTDYARMYWKAPNSTEKTIREQILDIIAEREAAE